MSLLKTRAQSKASPTILEWDQLLEQLSNINSAVSRGENKSTLNERIESLNVALTKKIDFIKTELSELNDSVFSHETELEKVKNRNKELELLVEELKSNPDLKKEFTDFQIKITNLEEENKNLSKKIIEFENIQQVKLQEEVQTVDTKQKKDIATGVNTESQNKMAVEPKDAILAIPVISNEIKELDAFINTCDLYMQLVEDDKKPKFLMIIKAKIRGEFLSRVSPLSECDTWATLKKRLRDRLKKPVSYEFAQEDLASIFQKRDESLDDYAKRVKEKLRRLNESSRLMADSEQEKKILMKANEKLAISKFEQNIRNDTIRVLVSASAKDSLDEAIQIAAQRDLMERNKNVHKCSICGLTNHSEETCRRRKSNETGGSQKQTNNKPNPFSKPSPNNFFKKENKPKNAFGNTSGSGNSNSGATSSNANPGNSNSGNSNPNQNYRKWNSSPNSNNTTKNVRNLDTKNNATPTLQQVLGDEQKNETKN